MNTLTAALAAFLCFFSSIGAAATNLLVNGSFGAGTLAPWVASEVVNVGPGFCVLGDADEDGIITQDVVTEAGKSYYLSLKVAQVRSDRASHFGTLSMNAVRANGIPAGSFSTENVTVDQYGMVFTVTVTQAQQLPVTRIQIHGGGVTITDVSLVELPPSPVAGAYVGTAKLRAIAGMDDPAEVLSSKVQRVRARVLPTGQFVIARDTEHIDTGILFDDNTYLIRSNGRVRHGEWMKRGNQVKLSRAYGISATEDTTGERGLELVPSEVTIEFTLNRRSK